MSSDYKNIFGKFNGNEAEYVLRALDSETPENKNFPWVQRFEEAFTKGIGTKYSIAVNSGTSGLHAALYAAGVKNGDEVIQPATTVVMDAYVTIHMGAVPVFVDICPKSWNIDSSKIEEKITEKTKAIIVVSLYGLPVDIEPIMEIAKKYNLIVIDDSAETLMTNHKGSNAGTQAHIGVYSFEKSNSNVSYVAVTEQYTDHKPGIMKQTNSELDMALDGPGYFSVSTEEGIRYTRNGNFRLNSEKQIVNQKGQPVLSEKNEPIVITAEGTEISIDSYGNIFVGSGERSANIGKIKFVDFKNKETLEKIGDSLFFQSDTEADEKPVNDTKLRQGFLEGSNITATDEMTNMISTVRLFETYQKIIQSIDNMNEQSVNSIGRIG